jgi:hypothetical protein
MDGKSAMRDVQCISWEGPTHDLPDDVGGGVEVDETLVNLHLVPVPGLGTLTTWALRERKERTKGQTDRWIAGHVWYDTHVLRVVIFKTLVGILTGPLTRRSLSLAWLIKAWQTVAEERAHDRI